LGSGGSTLRATWATKLNYHIFGEMERARRGESNAQPYPWQERHWQIFPAVQSGADRHAGRQDFLFIDPHGEVCMQNAREAAQAKQRDLDEWQRKIDRQLGERRALQQLMKEEQGRFERNLNVLHSQPKQKVQLTPDDPPDMPSPEQGVQRQRRRQLEL
jgi:hypothetical protein